MSVDNIYQSNIDKAFEIVSKRLEKVKDDANDHLKDWNHSSTIKIKTEPIDETKTTEIAENDQHNSQLTTYYSLLHQYSSAQQKPKQKKKKSNQIQIQNDIEYVSTKYPLYIKRNERNQVLLNEIKIESNEEETNNLNKFEFTTMNDLMMTEVVLSVFKHDLNNIQQGIDQFKTNCNEFRSKSISSINYERKKTFIIEYIKCQNEIDKKDLREKLVRLETIFFFYSFYYLFFNLKIEQIK